MIVGNLGLAQKNIRWKHWKKCSTNIKVEKNLIKKKLKIKKRWKRVFPGQCSNSLVPSALTNFMTNEIEWYTSNESAFFSHLVSVSSYCLYILIAYCYLILFYHLKNLLYQLYNIILQYIYHLNFYFTILHIKIWWKCTFSPYILDLFIIWSLNWFSS